MSALLGDHRAYLCGHRPAVIPEDAPASAALHKRRLNREAVSRLHRSVLGVAWSSVMVPHVSHTVVQDVRVLVEALADTVPAELLVDAEAMALGELPACQFIL